MRPASSILIADPSASRAQAVAALLAEPGRRIEIADHGVGALERALRENPDLVLAAHGLPLMDAPRLAEIVASSPRTRNARFLFLGEPDPSIRFEVAPGDEQIPATLRPEDIAEVARELLERQDRIADFDARTGLGERGAGTLEQLSLVDLVGLLHVGRKSGCLEVEHHDPVSGLCEGAIWVCDGEIVDARTGAAQREKALFRMLRWSDGEFSFGPGQWDEPSRMQVPTRALLAEGLRQLNEWTRLGARLPATDSLIRLRVRPEELPGGTHPLTRDVLGLLESHERVGDVVDHSRFPDYQVLRTLHTLVERGMASVHHAASPSEPRGDLTLFSHSQVRRLRDWVRDAQGRPRPLQDPRLLVSVSEPSALADFANLLRPMPSITLSTEMERGGIADDELTRLGRVRIDEQLGIELVHVPSVARFAPFWMRAAHGSLGVLFLLAGPVSEAVERLEPMVAAMHRLPRARLFHAVLLGKGERLAPDELHENLSLIDDASLFLLPLDTAKAPSTLVARMFSRLVP